ncbi:transposase [Candidatus Tisiphia endosymbiont of Neophilaenus lineatus]|uniref:transposase n=1 Tax=Candidatus Tisiphia endosymbiont of Neophilaenus lineatus TaxID=3139336 RepID=UPI0035CB92AF
MPSNITLIPLPPYAPELNAMEQVWEWIKNHFLSNTNCNNEHGVFIQSLYIIDFTKSTL